MAKTKNGFHVVFVRLSGVEKAALQRQRIVPQDHSVGNRSEIDRGNEVMASTFTTSQPSESRLANMVAGCQERRGWGCGTCPCRFEHQCQVPSPALLIKRENERAAMLAMRNRILRK